MAAWILCQLLCAKSTWAQPPRSIVQNHPQISDFKIVRICQRAQSCESNAAPQKVFWPARTDCCQKMTLINSSKNPSKGSILVCLVIVWFMPKRQWFHVIALKELYCLLESLFLSSSLRISLLENSRLVWQEVAQSPIANTRLEAPNHLWLWVNFALWKWKPDAFIQFDLLIEQQAGKQSGNDFHVRLALNCNLRMMN